MKENSDHIDQELLGKYLSQETSPEESLLVKNWINSANENRKEFEKLRVIWQKAAELRDFQEIDVEADWKTVKSKIPFAEKKETETRQLYSSQSHAFLYYFSRVAAVLLVFMGIAFVIYRSLNSDGAEMVAVETKFGEEKEIALPDGSKVFLNGNSKIMYRSAFKSRDVELEGEAFFEVVKNANAPFKVIAGKTVTEVLGTSFNLKNRAQEKTTVTLLSGKVAFYTKDENKENVTLEPGEQASYSEGKILKKTNENHNVISWKEDKLVFNDTELSKLVSNVEDYFGVKLEVADSALLNCRYTGSFQNPKLDNLLEILKATLELSVEKADDHYVLKGTGCE